MGKTLALMVTSHLQVAGLKAPIQKREGRKEGRERLMFAGKQLEDHHLCWSVGLRQEATVQLVLRLSGC
ncbi:unnamed protein product [Chrysoparadoxa australica]